MLIKRDKIILKSDLSEVHKLDSFIELICDQYDIYNNYFSNIILSLNEAFANAVTHGNQNDKSKKVSIEFINNSDGLCFTVSDMGNGFNFNDIKSPVDAETEEESQEGRGLFLMKSLSDDIKFTNNGSTVNMLFKISSINKELSDKRIKALKAYFVSNTIKVE